MQLFRSEEDIDEWSAHTRIAVGSRFPPQQLWALAQRWYDDRFDVDWRRRTLGERQAILNDVGLVGAFWHLR